MAQAHKKTITAKKIKALSKKYGYDSFVCNSVMAIVRKKDVFITIWHKTMTVGTTLTHPIKGRTTLFRKNIEPKEVEAILKNPRVHTEKGYYRKDEH